MFLKYLFGIYFTPASFNYFYVLDIVKDNMLLLLVILFIATILFFKLTTIILQCMNSGGIHYVNTERSALKMQAFHNPFYFEVDLQLATYSGVQCTFSCEKDCFLLPLWGVPIYELFALLNSSPRDLRHSITAFNKTEKFSSKCRSSNDVILLEGGEKKTLIFKPQRGYVNEADIRPKEALMRLTYPFVAIMLLQDQDVSEKLVIAMATVIHFPDEALKLPAQVLGQYVKFSSGPLNAIRKIFVSSPEASSVDGENVDLCLACYHRAISVVIMPCGHACVCDTCLEFCKNCPVCRGPAYSYFELQSIPRQ